MLLETTPLAAELDDIFNCIPYKELEGAILATRTRAFSPLGRFGYSVSSLLKAYLAGYVLGVKNTNDLLRRLQEDPILATICGFDYKKPPCRRTFIRFTKKLMQHQDLLDKCLNEITSKLGELLPNFGQHVVVDATPVHSHSNPDKKKVVSDPQADWVYKEGNKKKRWVWGYRLHLVVDANYELPIAKETTVSNEGEKAVAIPLLTKAKSEFPWFNPQAVICDKGYDSSAIYEAIVKELGADPIISIRRRAGGESPEITGSSAAPCCPGGLPLIYRSWDKDKGLQYQCPEKAGRAICPLAEQCPVKMMWVKPVHDYRRFGYRIKRGTEEFDIIYRQRKAVERVNSRLKDKRRLDSHCFRGLQKLNLHCTLSVLAMNAMALSKVKTDKLADIRGSCRKVA
jgi:hypothetical protein